MPDASRTGKTVRIARTHRSEPSVYGAELSVPRAASCTFAHGGDGRTDGERPLQRQGARKAAGEIPVQPDADAHHVQPVIGRGDRPARSRDVPDKFTESAFPFPAKFPEKGKLPRGGLRVFGAVKMRIDPLGGNIPAQPAAAKARKAGRSNPKRFMPVFALIWQRAHSPYFLQTEAMSA